MTDMNKALRVYQDYVAIKTHYTSKKYDYFLMNGKTKASKASFERRNDKNYFIQLSKKKDYFKYLIANIAYSNYWVGDIALNDMADKNYNTFRRRSEALSYTVRQDLRKLKYGNLKENFVFDYNGKFLLDSGSAHPSLLVQYVEDQITLETITVLINMTEMWRFWDNNFHSDPLWSSYRLKVIKHDRFLRYNKDDMRNKVLDFARKS